jgi:hypothetical protein
MQAGDPMKNGCAPRITRNMATFSSQSKLSQSTASLLTAATDTE